jgi:pSer/pThr/pTyr-binding forkhead associated (FHA) protein
VVLTVGDHEYTLTAPRALIGRATHCRIVIDDPLVSREHARLLISATSVALEDLRSANGVWVNNVRIFEPRALCDGDRILLGMRELVVSALPYAASTSPSTLPSEGVPKAVPPRGQVSTARADALLVLGRLAARRLSEGVPLDAEKVLEDHLMKLLVGARSGLPVPAATCATAGKQALLLAAALPSARWIDYTVELHLRAGLAMQPQTIALLEEAMAAAKGVDIGQYTYYVDLLAARLPELGEEGPAMIERLRAIEVK